MSATPHAISYSPASAAVHAFRYSLATCIALHVALMSKVVFVRQKGVVWAYFFYEYCPSILQRCCIKSWYPPPYPQWCLRSTNFLIIANLLIERNQNQLFYIAFLFTQVSLRICVWKTHFCGTHFNYAFCHFSFPGPLIDL